MPCNLETVQWLQIILHWEEITALKLHVANIVVKVEILLGDIQRHKAISRRLLIRTQELHVRPQRDPVVAVACLGEAGRAGKHKMCVLVVVVRGAVIVTVEDNAVVPLHNVDQGLQLGVVGAGRHIGVMLDEKLPVGVGLGKGLLEKVDLRLLRLVAVDHVVVVVDGRVLLVLFDEAVRVEVHKRGRPVLADKVVLVVRQLLGAKVPAVVVQRRDAHLELDAGVARHDVVVAEGLVPREELEDALLVHVHPGGLEAVDARGGHVDAAIVEVVAHGDECVAVLHLADLPDVPSRVHCMRD